MFRPSRIAFVEVFLATALTIAAQPRVITTIAGSELAFSGDGKAATSVSLGAITSVAADASGNVFLADSDNHMVMKVSPSGILTVLAGNGIKGDSGDGGLAIAASLGSSLRIAVSSRGNIYVADQDGSRVRLITPSGNITTVAGTGVAGFSGDGGPATQAALNFPSDIAVDANENLYIADFFNHRVRRVDTAGNITTVAGTGSSGFAGDGAPALSALLSNPIGVAVDSAGDLYIAEQGNSTIRMVNPQGVISTIARNLSFPAGIAADSAGNVLVAETGANRILQVKTNGSGSTPLATGLASPQDVALGPGSIVYVADTGNYRVRKVGAAGSLVNIAGNGGAASAGGKTDVTSPFELFQPIAIAIDSRGAFYVANQGRNNIVEISPNGIESLFAGTGVQGVAGDGGPATQAQLRGPRGISVDSTGNVYIGDNENSRVRKVSPNGIITTVIGGGTQSGEGVTGTQVKIVADVPSVLATPDGSVYFNDHAGFKIRRLKNGIVTTVAGTGKALFSGDGGLATSASLLDPRGIAADAAGNIYIPDSHRIRRITPDGLIDTIAGGGSSTDDVVPATTASLALLEGIAVDANGIIYFTEATSKRVRMLDKSGMVRPFAGNGALGFSGDGDDATKATLNFPEGIAVAANGDVYIADSGNNRIRPVLKSSPSISANPASISFQALSGDSISSPQSILVNGTVGGVPFVDTPTTSDGAPWLLSSPPAGSTPGAIEVSVDPSKLAAGTYHGTVTLTSTVTNPPRASVDVSLTVTSPGPPQLQVSPNSLSLSLNPRGFAAMRQIQVANLGTGPLSYTAAASTSAGGSWLSVTPASGNVTRLNAASLQVTADPSSLDPGTYQGNIHIASSTTGEQIDVSVLVTISAVRQSILLSQTGLNYVAVAQGGSVPSQQVGVLNTGEGIMQWIAAASTSSGGNWLGVSPTSGSTDASSVNVPLIDVSISPPSLPPGTYSGTIRVSSGGAINSPQFVSVFLTVLPAGSNPGPVVRPSGLIFGAQQAGPQPGSQTIQVNNLTASGLNYNSGQITVGGVNLVSYLPVSSTVQPATPLQITVQPQLAGLAPGIRRSVITLGFDDGSIRTVGLLTLVLSGSGTVPNTRKAAGCLPGKLLPLFTSLFTGGSVPVSFPGQVEAKVVDDCNTPLSDGSVTASFSNGDPPISLTSLKDGRWTGTWIPFSAPSTTATVTVDAASSDLSLRGSNSISVGLTTSSDVPVVYPSGILSTASLGTNEPVAPGSLISIFGSKLADGAVANSTVPLSNQLGDTSVLVGGETAPLLYVSDKQINATIPYDLSVNTTHQLIVVHGSRYSVPVNLTIANAGPAIFTANQSGGGQGLVFDSNYKLVDSSNPGCRRPSGHDLLRGSGSRGSQGRRWSARTGSGASKPKRDPTRSAYRGLSCRGVLFRSRPQVQRPVSNKRDRTYRSHARTRTHCYQSKRSGKPRGCNNRSAIAQRPEWDDLLAAAVEQQFLAVA